MGKIQVVINEKLVAVTALPGCDFETSIKIRMICKLFSLKCKIFNFSYISSCIFAKTISS